METVTKPPFRCIVNADLFRRAMCCISKEPTRYYLNGVHIEPHKDGGALLVSTDGHRLIVIYDKDAIIEGGSAIIKLDPAMFKAKSSLPKALVGARRHVVVSGNRIAYMVGEYLTVDKRVTGLDIDKMFDRVAAPDMAVIALQWSDCIIDGKFPDWRRVVPKQIVDDAKIGEFNAEYLRELARALSGNGEATRVLASSQDDGSPHFVFGTASMVDGFGIILPMRGRCSKSAIPAWMDEPERVVAPVAVEPVVAKNPPKTNWNGEPIAPVAAPVDITQADDPRVDEPVAVRKQQQSYPKNKKAKAKVTAKKPAPAARNKPARKAAVAVRRAPARKSASKPNVRKAR